MRQIGDREDAALKGGCGPCGKQLCCSTFLKGFEPISIKMAKSQGLSLNPSKISGMCGRLMCCLKYEYDPETRAPKKQAGGGAGGDVKPGPTPAPPASSTTPAS
jgi:cell fate regulator YaaT (PSP1 superfamily)